MLKSKNIISTLSICALIFFNSCSKDENLILEESIVITEQNFEILRTNALNNYNQVDFSKLTKPTPNTVDYKKIIEILNNNDQQLRSEDFNFTDYEYILGEYYDEGYFNQLTALYGYAEEIILSDLFEESSTLEERQEYLEEILIYVILEDINQNNLASRYSNCYQYYNNCTDQAERDHGIRIASCTGTAVFLGVLTGGAGAATWPICMATSGFLYDSAMTTCSDNLEVCLDQ